MQPFYQSSQKKNISPVYFIKTFALLTGCQLWGMVKGRRYRAEEPRHHSGGWRRVLVSDSFRPTCGQSCLLLAVVMHLLFASTGCHSQTGASSLQIQMFAVSWTRQWSASKKRGMRPSTSGAGPKTETRCQTAAAAAQTTGRRSCRTPRYRAPWTKVHQDTRPYACIICCIFTPSQRLLQYLFDIKHEGEVALISLQQRDLKIYRREGRGENLSIGFGVFKVRASRLAPHLSRCFMS